MTRVCDHTSVGLLVWSSEKLLLIQRFGGEGYETAYVPARAREVLDRFDERSTHYEVKQRMTY